MKLIADFTLRLYDEGAFLEDDPRRLLELFLDSIGITSDVARDVFHILLVARASDTALSAKQIREAVVSLRNIRKETEPEKGLTMRNVQVWLRYFRDIRLADNLGSLYRFRGNKMPSRAFSDGTRPLVLASLDYAEKLLRRVEGAYSIGK
ncbi:MAG: hypothetical protein PHG85_03445 [Candidatus Altiarchaeota archaeon]|nr:hypothetical protein [Candidatus Altiarchaeota archaeon]